MILLLTIVGAYILANFMNGLHCSENFPEVRSLILVLIDYGGIAYLEIILQNHETVCLVCAFMLLKLYWLWGGEVLLNIGQESLAALNRPAVAICIEFADFLGSSAYLPPRLLKINP